MFATLSGCSNTVKTKDTGKTTSGTVAMPYHWTMLFHGSGIVTSGPFFIRFLEEIVSRLF